MITSGQRPVRGSDGCARHSHDDPRAQGAPQGHSHHKKYRSQYPATTDARSRERGANALWLLCENAYACLAIHTHIHESTAVYM